MRSAGEVVGRAAWLGMCMRMGSGMGLLGRGDWVWCWRDMTYECRDREGKAYGF